MTQPIHQDELVRGLIYGNNRSNANTMAVHEASSTIEALTELLVERGVLDRDTVETRRKETATRLRERYVERGMVVAMQDFGRSKYEFQDGPQIDCENRVHLCRAACCRLRFALSPQDVQEGVVRWELGQPYLIAHDSDGCCVHLDRERHGCTIYDRRPMPCRGYDCRNDARIWLDFEKRIVNPRVADPDWPKACETGAPQEAPASPLLRIEDAPPSDTRRAALRRSPLQPSGAIRPANGVEHAVMPHESIATAGDEAGPSSVEEDPVGLVERLLRPEIRVFGRPWPVYRAFVFLGVISGAVIASALAPSAGLSLPTMGALAGLGIVTAVVLGLATKLALAYETFSFYHYHVAVLAICGTTLWLLHLPVLAYLDLTALALCIALAWGRVGCFLGGCCHGRPHAWGVRYSAAHATAGFPACYVGARLLPVQFAESLLLWAVIAAAIPSVLGGGAPGETLALLNMAYGAGRFFLEFVRGDSGRAHFGGFSEAQWTAVLLISGVAVAEIAGALPLRAWHLVAAVAVWTTLAVVAVSRVLALGGTRLLHPDHLEELAEIVRTAELQHPEQSEIRVACTTAGLRISAERYPAGQHEISQYTLSCSTRSLRRRTVHRLGRFIQRLQHPRTRLELRGGERGVYHVLLHSLRSSVSACGG